MRGSQGDGVVQDTNPPPSAPKRTCSLSEPEEPLTASPGAQCSQEELRGGTRENGNAPGPLHHPDVQTQHAWKGATVRAISHAGGLECRLRADTRGGVFPWRTFSPPHPPGRGLMPQRIPAPPKVHSQPHPCSPDPPAAPHCCPPRASQLTLPQPSARSGFQLSHDQNELCSLTDSLSILAG